MRNADVLTAQYTGGGGTLALDRAAPARSLVTDVRARLPELWVGKLTDPPVERQLRVYADGDTLRFERYDAEASSGAGAPPAEPSTSIKPSRRSSIGSTSLIRCWRRSRAIRTTHGSVTGTT